MLFEGSRLLLLLLGEGVEGDEEEEDAGRERVVFGVELSMEGRRVVFKDEGGSEGCDGCDGCEERDDGVVVDVFAMDFCVLDIDDEGADTATFELSD